MQGNQFASNITNEDVERMFSKEDKGGSATNTSMPFDVKNYLNTRLEKGEKERVVVIRILPIVAGTSNLCAQLCTHGFKLSTQIAKSGFKSFMCLNDKNNPNYDPSVKCPLCEKADRLYHESLEARNRGDIALADSLLNQAKPYFRKTTYIYRVIERGKEHEGVKFWRFNGRQDKKDPHNELLKLYRTRQEERKKYQGVDGYNIFDLWNGHDIQLTLTPDTKGSRENTAISVVDISFDCPLSNDVNQVNAWINDPKHWSDVYANKSPEYLRIIAEEKIPRFDQSLQKYIAIEPTQYVQAPKQPASPQPAAPQQPMVPSQPQYPQQPVMPKSPRPNQQSQPYPQGYPTTPTGMPQVTTSAPQQPRMNTYVPKGPQPPQTMGYPPQGYQGQANNGQPMNGRPQQ